MKKQTLFLNSSELRTRLDVGINASGNSRFKGVSWPGKFSLPGLI